MKIDDLRLSIADRADRSLILLANSTGIGWKPTPRVAVKGSELHCTPP
jgi:hypothetical protein